MEEENTVKCYVSGSFDRIKLQVDTYMEMYLKHIADRTTHPKQREVYIKTAEIIIDALDAYPHYQTELLRKLEMAKSKGRA